MMVLRLAWRTCTVVTARKRLRGKGRRVQRVITLNGDSTPYSRMKFTAGEDWAFRELDMG
jgi:hypothetical protein